MARRWRGHKQHVLRSRRMRQWQQRQSRRCEWLHGESNAAESHSKRTRYAGGIDGTRMAGGQRAALCEAYCLYQYLSAICAGTWYVDLGCHCHFGWTSTYSSCISAATFCVRPVRTVLCNRATKRSLSRCDIRATRICCGAASSGPAVGVQSIHRLSKRRTVDHKPMRPAASIPPLPCGLDFTLLSSAEPPAHAS